MEIDTLWDLNGLNEILPLFDNLLVQKETQETRFRAKRIGIEIFRKLIGQNEIWKNYLKLHLCKSQ